MKKKIMLDMSATLIHHGHVRIIKKAQKYGNLIIALTTDKEINKYKGYIPELKFKHRKEILLAIKGVKKVVPSPWVITQKFLNQYRVDLLISGSDYKKRKFITKTIYFERTKLISSKLLRKKAAKIVNKIYER